MRIPTLARPGWVTTHDLISGLQLAYYEESTVVLQDGHDRFWFENDAEADAYFGPFETLEGAELAYAAQPLWDEVN